MYAVKLQTYRLGYTGQQESSTAMYHRSEVRKLKNKVSEIFEKNLRGLKKVGG
jgi:hypothetical protein